MRIPRKEQFTGCLIGQCLGDALGFPVEGYPPGTCQQYVDEILKAGHAGELGRSPFPFGQYTDDSQLARELLQSYAACERFDPEEYAHRIAAIFVEERIVGRGWATGGSGVASGTGRVLGRGGNASSLGPERECDAGRPYRTAVLRRSPAGYSGRTRSGTHYSSG